MSSEYPVGDTKLDNICSEPSKLKSDNKIEKTSRDTQVKIQYVSFPLPQKMA